LQNLRVLRFPKLPRRAITIQESYSFFQEQICFSVLRNWN